MESEISKMQTKIPPKSFSIESIVGLNERRSPEIDIENSISQEFSGNHDNSEDEEKAREEKMGYFYPQQNRVPNFPFFMSYENGMKRILGSGYPSGEGKTAEEGKRGSTPGSVRSEVDNESVEDRPSVEPFVVTGLRDGASFLPPSACFMIERYHPRTDTFAGQLMKSVAWFPRPMTFRVFPASPNTGRN
ncbi:hypothetical protein EVAR_89013_1 [Eumeta japonica]|uniref:Uncharacterized protein n=1 Tax=Eumeta variegata TaxID=151549 RepID=A0A4C1XAI6_EUMVA|nr:hypothetical protein EVAR_89013_1 [Eumeta japonica]